MKIFIKDSVRLRILFATLLPIIFVFITIIPIFSYYLRSGFDREIENRLISVASLISTTPNLEYAVDFKEGDEELLSYQYLVNKLKTLRDIASLRAIFIFNKEGRILLSSEGEKIGKKMVRLDIDRKEIDMAFQKKNASSVLFVGDDGLYYKNAYVPILLPNGNVGAVLGVSASVTYFKTLVDIRNGIVLILFISLLLVILIISIISKSISSPVADMIAQAKLIARGNFEKPLKTETYGELAILVDTFEQMRERIMNRDNEMQMMLSGIAHEIRNPLGGMQLMIDLLREKFKGDEEVSSLVLQLDNELKYLSNVVNSFLNYSRNKSLVREKVNIKNVIDEAVDILMVEIEKKKIDIKREILDIEIVSDYDVLKQIMINILLNSVQAIETAEGKVEILSYKDSDNVVIKVSDNGIGIKPEDMKNIFKPFFTTKEKGTGLGLPLVKKYINQLGGKIEIESEFGKGCVVKIYLPLS